MDRTRALPLTTHALARIVWCTLFAAAFLAALLWWHADQAGAREDVPTFRFVLTADVRSYAGPPYDTGDYFPGAVQAIDHLGAGDMMVALGDMDPPVEAYGVVTRVLGASYPWHPVVGNHELPGAGAEITRGANIAWLRSYDRGVVNAGPPGCPATTYSLDVQNAHLVVLNEYCDSAGPDVTNGDIPDHLYNWLRNDLRATDQQHIFVYGHEPAYPQVDADVKRARHMDDSLNAHPANRDRFWALLREEGVTAYFCGHTHNYSVAYMDGVWQVDVGHARGRGDTGAPSTFVVIDVEGEQVTYETYRDVHNGDYDYDDIIHRGVLAPTWELAFQDGVAPAPGYAGVRDAYVEADLPDVNYGSVTPLIADGSPDRASLLRWDVAHIPPGSLVTHAALVLQISDPTVGSYGLYALRGDWLETEVTWRERAAGVPWQVPGARGTGDRGGEVLGTIAASARGVYRVDLGAAGRALVQQWIDDPAANHGIVAVNHVSVDAVRFGSREEKKPSRRPRLELSVIPSRVEPEVAVGGPAAGDIDTAYTFAAYVRPIDAPSPVTYVWHATEQDMVTHAGSVAMPDTQGYAWTTEGLKTVTVTATHAGGTVTGTHTIAVSRRVQADLIAQPRIGAAPLTVAFTNTSTCSYTVSSWDFGDGATSTLPAPTHTYTEGGLYDVTLIIGGPLEVCTTTKVHYIHVLHDNVVYLPLALTGY